jgi:RNA polymerase sigma-70 factor (sigma-E family)
MTTDNGSQVPARDEAVALLWEQHHAGLVRLAVGLTAETGAAEEIVQDAFTALLRRWWRLRDRTAAYAYLQRAVVNGARSRWRRRQRQGQAVAALAPQPAADDPDIDSQLDLLGALRRLSPSKRACLVLRFYADLPQAQVADLLGVSVGTVKSQTAKGLRQLEAVLNEARSEMR